MCDNPKSADFGRTRRTWPDMLRNNSMTWHEIDLKFSVHALIFFQSRGSASLVAIRRFTRVIPLGHRGLKFVTDV